MPSPRAGFLWSFFPVKSELFLTTVAMCLLTLIVGVSLHYCGVFTLQSTMRRLLLCYLDLMNKIDVNAGNGIT